MIHYSCPPEALPVVEAAFATRGYREPLAFHRAASHSPLTVLIGDDATALLIEAPSGGAALIEIYGMAKARVSEWLEALPLSLQRC
jgi:hypothetical protein